MRMELIRLHRELGATMLYVTHDQTEAMTMADRIIVMNGGNIEQIVNIAALCPQCDIYSGNDDHVLPVLSVGGKGVISTIANIVPGEMHALCDAFFKGDLQLARELQLQLIPIWKAAF